jgi:ATP-dependent DNA ligase
VQLKHNGFHLGYRGDDGPFTREGVPFACASHLVPGLEAVDQALLILTGERHALFGEYVHADGFEAVLADFQRGVGSGIVMLFDAVPLDAYAGRAPSPLLWQRLAYLKSAMDRAGGAARNVGVGMPPYSTFKGEARDNIEIAVAAVWECGEEGFVVKDADSPYERAKSRHWRKLKRVETIDVPIIEVRTNLMGKLKSIDVALPGGGETNVPVGFSTADRDHPKRFRAGAIVEIKHNGLRDNGTPISPVYLRLRPDKEN